MELSILGIPPRSRAKDADPFFADEADLIYFI